jgi:hypothetical protein
VRAHHAVILLTDPHHNISTPHPDVYVPSPPTSCCTYRQSE